MPTINLRLEVKEELKRFKLRNHYSSYSDSVNILLERARTYKLLTQFPSQLQKFAETLELNKGNPKADTKKEKVNNLESDMNKSLETNEVIEEEIIDLPDFDDDLD